MYRFGLLTPYNYFTAKRDILNGKLIQVISGEADPCRNERKIIRNFKIHAIYSPGGCTATMDEIYGMKIYNETMANHIDELYGNGWTEEFEERLYNCDTTIIELK